MADKSKKASVLGTLDSIEADLSKRKGEQSMPKKVPHESSEGKLARHESERQARNDSDTEIAMGSLASDRPKVSISDDEKPAHPPLSGDVDAPDHAAVDAYCAKHPDEDKAAHLATHWNDKVSDMVTSNQ